MHRYSVSLLSLLILGVLLSPASGQPPLRPAISVMNLKSAGGVSEDDALLLTDRLLVELARTGRFEVTERSRRDEILKEQAFQQTGACDEASCLAQIGKLLGVQKMVGGAVGKVGGTYTVSLRVVDVETGRIDQTAVKDFTGSVDYLLKSAMKEVAWELAEGRVQTVPPRVQHGRVVRRKWGVWSFFLGSASGVAGAVFKIQANGYYNKYRSAPDRVAMNDYKNKTKSADLVANSLFIASGVFLTSSGALFLSSRGGGEKIGRAGGAEVHLGFVQPTVPGAVLVLRF